MDYVYACIGFIYTSQSSDKVNHPFNGHDFGRKFDFNVYNGKSIRIEL